MMKVLASAIAASLVLASMPAKAEIRPETTTLAIMVDDDEVGEEMPGWLWTGVGILVGLGILIFISGGSDVPEGRPNSPR